VEFSHTILLMKNLDIGVLPFLPFWKVQSREYSNYIQNVGVWKVKHLNIFKMI